MSKYDKAAVIPFEEWLEWTLVQDDSTIDWKVYSRIGLPPCYRNYPLSKPIYDEYTLRAWEDPNRYLLDRYSLEQVSEYLWSASRASLSGDSNRQWDALQNLFANVFVLHVSNSLGHLGEHKLSSSSLDAPCYLWWELRSYRPRKGSSSSDEKFIAFCEWCLQSDSAGVQESAIHGLGHSLQRKKGFTSAKEILQKFIQSKWAKRPELNYYAEIALTGQIL